MAFFKGKENKDKENKENASKKPAYDVAVAYLASRRRTEKEVREKLKEKEYSLKEIDSVIKKLKSDGYIDDYEYAKSYTRYSYEKRRGARRILAELDKRGIDSSTARVAIDDYKNEECIDERNIAKSVVLSEIGEQTEMTEKLLGRLHRRLENAGFELADIHAVLNEVSREMRDRDE